jgi:hypothetical protein
MSKHKYIIDKADAEQFAPGWSERGKPTETRAYRPFAIVNHTPK